MKEADRRSCWMARGGKNEPARALSRARHLRVCALRRQKEKGALCRERARACECEWELSATKTGHPLDESSVAIAAAAFLLPRSRAYAASRCVSSRRLRSCSAKFIPRNAEKRRRLKRGVRAGARIYRWISASAGLCTAAASAKAKVEECTWGFRRFLPLSNKHGHCMVIHKYARPHSRERRIHSAVARSLSLSHTSFLCSILRWPIARARTLPQLANKTRRSRARIIPVNRIAARLPMYVCMLCVRSVRAKKNFLYWYSHGRSWLRSRPLRYRRNLLILL